jgi:GTP pyrophosphokinase|tara:strand:+ start:133 stop:687 length:555 start_codon:yes stop_codon:yes gene_type:complete
MAYLRQYIRALIVEDFDRVYTTADYAHLGQKRRTGEPYIVHPERVSQIVNQYYPGNKVAQMTALLHDTLEDAIDLGNVADEEEMIALIDDSIDDDDEANEVISSVMALTKPSGTDYENYVLSILDSPTTVIVKLADMLDNLTDNPSEKQKQKYSNALEVIKNHFNGPPNFISGDHWNALINATK